MPKVTVARDASKIRSSKAHCNLATDLIMPLLCPLEPRLGAVESTSGEPGGRGQAGLRASRGEPPQEDAQARTPGRSRHAGAPVDRAGSRRPQNPRQSQLLKKLGSLWSCAGLAERCGSRHSATPLRAEDPAGRRQQLVVGDAPNEGDIPSLPASAELWAYADKPGLRRVRLSLAAEGGGPRQYQKTPINTSAPAPPCAKQSVLCGGLSQLVLRRWPG